ncbi:MAG: LptE family protein [Bacteroidetes bacterium]|nr:LptE family protein [Bacteroidota bacterium]
MNIPKLSALFDIGQEAVKGIFNGWTFIGFFVLLTGCHIYSFTGASISPEVKTISIKYFPNRAALVQPTLSQRFTDALKDKFMRETNLSLVENNGDLLIEGEVSGYNTQPVAIQSNQQAALNRLTITVKVKFVNKFNESQNFETSFSRFQDYESSLSLADVEDGLIDVIDQDLIQDIFNKAVVNW